MECLRFMATGCYPPNAPGNAFVTDPKLLGRSEVKRYERGVRRGEGKLLALKTRRARGREPAPNWRVEELKQEQQAEQDKLMSVSSSKQFYKDCLSFIEQRHACPVCKRAFDKPEGMKPVLESLQKRITHVAPTMMSQQQSQLSELRGRLENLQRLSGTSEDMLTVEKATLPSLLAEHDQLAIQENELAQEISLQEKQLKAILTILEKFDHASVQLVVRIVQVFNEVPHRHELMTVGYLIKDLDYAYHKLDRCMMQFHKSKIEQINAILQELWQNIYKGSDIDYIQISADDEGTSSATGRCSYNYRVVMMKGEIEMGMRGRCSAGQKVLACILIRLALAETFCGKCGIIALDEPTTNLDQRNVASLAENLIDLLEAKAQGKSNFQMILITHDQKFVEKFAHSEFVEHYWRLTKTDNYSQIQKLAFSHNSY